MSIRYSEEEYAALIARRAAKGQDRVAIQATDLERDVGNGPTPADAGQEMDSRVHIHFHSKRRRPIDPDGLYSKACIDGLREGGLLVDDSARYVKAVSYSQESSTVEETIITVELVK